jgi:hypothetical protein
MALRLIRSASHPMGTCTTPLTKTPSITRMPMADAEIENSMSAKTGRKPQMIPMHAV